MKNNKSLQITCQKLYCESFELQCECVRKHKYKYLVCIVLSEQKANHYINKHVRWQVKHNFWPVINVMIVRNIPNKKCTNYMGHGIKEIIGIKAAWNGIANTLLDCDPKCIKELSLTNKRLFILSNLRTNKNNNGSNISTINKLEYNELTETVEICLYWIFIIIKVLNRDIINYVV